jgi:putative Holliday junction resolvase
VAVSDPGAMLARPLAIITREGEAKDVGALAEIISQYEVTGVIVGLPRTLRGDLGDQAAKVKAFVQAFRSRVSVPVELRDERLSTVSARRLMRETGRKVQHDDAIAAAVVLQAYLDERQ